eukprot:gnl/TRDRNA2_/TRDRNA2_47642_c0_seq1.p1 gnl/TRDRNA2_/TRDRNA2_47642_c0~~gnl/TRDRNA2_/TRDRNA2_47642_c0_seq1.p1  ORF type:complete len:210 (+),score=31.20 gnl/TRDRNA2_/TRDRNA2_47642_c0_seq1:58-630(+)
MKGGDVRKFVLANLCIIIATILGPGLIVGGTLLLSRELTQSTCKANNEPAKSPYVCEKNGHRQNVELERGILTSPDKKTRRCSPLVLKIEDSVEACHKSALHYINDAIETPCIQKGDGSCWMIDALPLDFLDIFGYILVVIGSVFMLCGVCHVVVNRMVRKGIRKSYDNTRVRVRNAVSKAAPVEPRHSV